MFYGIYLAGIIFWILRGIGGGFGTLLNYMDGFTGMFVLVPCVLILFCTQSFKAFGRAFLFAFGKRDGSVVSYRGSLLAVKMVMGISGLFGFLGFLIGMSSSIRSMEDLSSIESLGWLTLDLSVAIISLVYPLLICIILLPVCFMLKKHLTNNL
ncbi:MAG: hypothetical protein HFH19_00620 [Ruminococcus sp.]|nr:hypothetical protein [Ruminococcus sp.]